MVAQYILKISDDDLEKIIKNANLIQKETTSVNVGYWSREITRATFNVRHYKTTPDAGEFVHDLKIHTTYFEEMLSGIKTNEIRMADRPFEVGHWLLLREWNQQNKTYTGRQIYKEITYITKTGFGLENYWILSLRC